MNKLTRLFYESIETGSPVPIPYREILATAWMMDDIFAQIPKNNGAPATPHVRSAGSPAWPPAKTISAAMTEFIHTDCRHYRGSMPCSFHKRDGRLCEICADYAPVRNRILIIKLAAIGDVLRTTSILPPLENKYPQSEITWITKANAVPLLKDNPEVDRVFTVEDRLSGLLGKRIILSRHLP